MTPSQKAFIDAHLGIFTACQDCWARVASFAKNGYLPIKPEALAIVCTSSQVTSCLGLDERYREQISRTPSGGVWEGLCTCRRRWRYAQANMHSDTGQLSVTVRPEPIAPEVATAKVATAEVVATARVATDEVSAAVEAKPGGAPPSRRTSADAGSPQSASPQPAQAQPRSVAFGPSASPLRVRTGARLPFVDNKATSPYFATMFRHERPIREALCYRSGSFILLLTRRKSAHKHPDPLDRPELQNVRSRSLDEADVLDGLPALLEVPVEHFDESLLDGLCCLDVSAFVSADGCLYHPLTSTSYDVETPGSFPSAMPDGPHPRRGLTPGDLRTQIVQEFPWIFRQPSPNAKESGLIEGRTTDVLAARGFGRHAVVLAVEWNTIDYSPEDCPKGQVHAPMMRRHAVRDWVRHSVSTTGFVTQKNEPLLIAMRSAPALLDDDLCCLSVRVLVPGAGATFHRFASNKVRWETR